jgi:hypothetical protein
VADCEENTVHYFVELWTMNDQWRALSVPERTKLMDEIGAFTGPILDKGEIEVLGWGRSDRVDEYFEGHEWVGIWRSATREPLLELAKAIEDSGWYTYADQKNVFSPIQDVADAVAETIANP